MWLRPWNSIKQQRLQNLILVESPLVGQELMGELERLAEVCDEGTNVVVIGHQNDVQLYRDLISRGVAEYLYAPISMADVMEVVTTLFVNPEASPLGKYHCFYRCQRWCWIFDRCP